MMMDYARSSGDVAERFNFSGSDLFKRGIPKELTFRQSAAVRQSRILKVKPQELVKKAVQRFIPEDSPNSFNYANIKSGEIRLLSIQPGTKGEQVRLVMGKAYLTEVNDMYNALSYSWGEVPKEHRFVFIEDTNPPMVQQKLQNAKQTNLVQDLSRSLQSNWKIKMKNRWDKLKSDEYNASPARQQDIRNRSDKLFRLEELMIERAKLYLEKEDALQVDEAKEGQMRADRKRLAKEFRTIDEEYDRLYPVSVDDAIHQKRLRDRLNDINRSPGEKINVSQRFYVRPNLYSALEHLRQPHEPVNIWVDAICINQQSNGLKEKDEQLAQMSSIYGGARNVIVWLGESDKRAGTAISLIEQMLDYTKLGALMEKLDLHPEEVAHVSTTTRRTDILNGVPHNLDMTPSVDQNEITAAHWFNLIDLLRRPWFSRRWIIQEIGMAKNAVVYIGHQTVHWDDLADVILLINDKADELRRRSRFHDTFDDIEGLSASVLVKVIGQACRRSPDGSVQIKTMTLEALVCSLLAFDSYFPKDSIYSILSLASDWPEIIHSERNDHSDLLIGPDFKRSVRDIFIAFVRRSIIRTGSLDIICRHWAPAVIKNSVGHELLLPSWISTVDKTPFGRPSSAYGRQYGENFVGFHHGDTRRRYHASQGRSINTDWKRLIKRLEEPQEPQVAEVEVIEEEPANTAEFEITYDRQNTSYLNGQAGSTVLLGKLQQSPTRAEFADSEIVAAPSHDLNVDGHSRFEGGDIASKTQSSAKIPNGLSVPINGKADSRSGISEVQYLNQAQTLQRPPRERRPSRLAIPLERKAANDSVPGTPKGRRRPTSVSNAKDRLLGILEVDGFIFGQIKSVSGTMKGDIEGGWIKKLGWESAEYNNNSVPERLWQTLVAGRDPQGAAAPTWYRRACLHALSDPKVTDMEGFVGVKDSMLRSAPLDEYTRRYLKRVSHVIMKRRLFHAAAILESGNDELYGLAPDKTEQGDYICILFGCSVPVILREAANRTYVLIGEAFVHGKMEGEAVKDWEKAHEQTVAFRII